MENQTDTTSDSNSQQKELRDLFSCEIVLVGGGEVVITGI